MLSFYDRHNKVRRKIDGKRQREYRGYKNVIFYITSRKNSAFIDKIKIREIKEKR